MKKIVLTKAAPIPISTYSQAVMNENMLFISGLLGQDPESGKLVNNTIEDEIRQVFKNMQAIVEDAGFSLDDVYKTTVFVTDFTFYGEFNKIYKEFFPDNYPARSSIQVAGLLADARIEVEAIAVKSK
jgi:2-iminobutanoate/2-iminopropanoate deaminase